MQFFENLEVLFFNNSLINIGKWGTNEYTNDTVKIVSKIAALGVSLCAVYYIPTNTLIARRGPL